MSKYPDQNKYSYRDEPAEDIGDVHDVTLGPDAGGGIHAAAAATGKPLRRRWYRNPIVLAGAACLVVLIVLAVVLVAASGGGSSSNGSSAPAVGTDLPPPEVPLTQLEKNRNELAAVLLPRYTARGMDMSVVSNPESFQGRALDYVAGSDIYAQSTEDENVERYAIVVFYLSTFRQQHLLNAEPEAWVGSDKWLTNSDLCQWEGIECNRDEYVVGIVLTENKMSGIIPLELSLLDNLQKINLSSNLLYMDEDNHGLWSILPNLQELIMDDNYFISETGIPVEFAGLSSIEKISLSFNLLQGTFDEQVFGSMTTLVHFEAESNYIAGKLPDNFLKLPNLTYIYIRRNSFEFPLSEIFVDGNLPSVFALWLDGNVITGTIPASIGLFTGIASLSITDAQLTGPIPTEMGLLTDLQRLWLYDNQLTGPIPETAAAQWSNIEVFEVYANELVGAMPQPICTAIANSNYNLKTLSADCQEVSCENCCTDCY